MTKTRCDSPGLCRSHTAGLAFVPGEEQHPEFHGITERLSHGWDCPIVQEGPFTSHGGRRCLCSSSLGTCQPAGRCGFFGQWVRCVHVVWSLCKAGACHGTSWWALPWLRVLLSGWAENNTLTGREFLSASCCFAIAFFLDVKQIKWNNFFRNILLY